MISMTGYASKEMRNEDFSLFIEMKSYNNRYLDIKHSMPSVFSPFEQEIDSKIKEVASRGSVEISIRYKQFTTSTELIVNEQIVKQYKEAYSSIQEIVGAKDEASLNNYISLEGIITTVNTLDISQFHTPLFALLDEVLVEFKHVRCMEGEATKSHLISLITGMKDSVEKIKTYSVLIEEKLKDSLLKKMKELMGNSEYDENRFLQEVALLLVKYSIEEELNRLSTHFISFDTLIDSSEAVGKKLDFLSQEMNREINTIGSKSMLGEVSQLVVNLKDSLENIREQLRNIE